MFGLFGLFLIGTIGLFSAAGWEKTLDQLGRLSILQVCALLSLSLVNYIFRGLRWHLFATRLGLGLTPATNLLHFVAGFAMTITPGRLGELVRLRWIARHTNWRFTSIAPLPLVDRAFDMAGMGIVLSAGLIFARVDISGAFSVAALALSTAFIITRPRLLAWLISLLHKMIGKWSRSFSSARRAARSMVVFDKVAIIAPALTLTMIGWLAEGVSLFLLLNWLGSDVSLAMAIVVFLFSTLAGGLTGAPGGIGGAEATMLFLLSMNGVAMEVSVPATAVIRVTSLWFAIVVGLLTFPIAERRAKSAIRRND
ncbi:MAG: lysylphosphatidylglycerol synthase transmembrane domain-containing protein [Litoreibacter sp.]